MALKKICYILIIIIMTACSHPVTVNVTPSYTRASPTEAISSPTSKSSDSPTLTSTVVIPQPTITPSPTPSSTPEPVNYSLIPTSLDNQGAWSFIDPRIAALPELIIPNGNGYRLRTDWEAGVISFLYQWGSFGESIISYQTVRWNNAEYTINGAPVEARLISSILNSINNLYPSPTFINSLTHTDDYPNWIVELVGKDGSRIELISYSNTDNAIPWNIIYNGRIYITYDPSILPALTQLFNTQIGIPMASFYPGTSQDSLPIYSEKLPNQLVQGFSGLIPISDRFSYSFDENNRTIDGKIDNRYPIDTFSPKVSGVVTDLQKVEITILDQIIDCQIVYDTHRDVLEVLSYGKSETAAWKFNCPLPNSDLSTTWKIPIAMTFTTDRDESIITYGELYGLTNNYSQRAMIPLPDNIKSIFSNNPNINDLMKDHIVELGEFIGDSDLIQGIPIDSLISQLNLYGQFSFQNKTIKYRISSPINIDHGTIVKWDLDREKLDQFLIKVLQNPLVKRILTTELPPELDLWYAEAGGNTPDVPGGIGGYAPNFSYELLECPLLYSNKVFPNAFTTEINRPFMAFGFNRMGHQPYFQFLIDGKKIVPINISLSPYYGDPSDYLSILTPVELQINGHPPIGSVDLYIQDWMPGKFYIWAKWDPESVTPEDIEAYRQKIQSSDLPFVEMENGYKLVGSVFWISEDGFMTIKPCH
jgi:hypothetical protein